MMLAAGLCASLALLLGQLVNYAVRNCRARKEDRFWLAKIRGSHSRRYVY